MLKNSISSNFRSGLFWYVNIILMFPLFPFLMKDSQIHINIVMLILSLFVVLKKRNEVFNYIIPLCIFYIFNFFLLFLSISFDLVNSDISYLFSLLRPMIYISLSISLVCFFCNEDDHISVINYAMAFFVVTSFIYSLLELSNYPAAKELIGLLYKRPYKTDIQDVSTTFFGVTYSAGFAYLSSLVFTYSNFLANKSYRSLFLVFLNVLLILFCQSKPMILCMVIMIMWPYYFRSKFLIKLLLAIFLVILTNLFFLNTAFIVDFINSNFYEVRFLRSIARILNPELEAMTLYARIDQIYLAIKETEYSYHLLGAGMGKGVYLETWLAALLYRVGSLGLLAYIFYCTYLYLCSKKLSLVNQASYHLYSLVCCWIILLPISQLSSLIIETSKGIFLMALFSVVILFNRRVYFENNSIYK